jgi:hypothetical protein
VALGLGVVVLVVVLGLGVVVLVVVLGLGVAVAIGVVVGLGVALGLGLTVGVGVGLGSTEVSRTTTLTSRSDTYLAILSNRVSVAADERASATFTLRQEPCLADVFGDAASSRTSTRLSSRLTSRSSRWMRFFLEGDAVERFPALSLAAIAGI